MNKNILYLIIGILVLGGGFYFLNSTQKEQATTPTDGKEQVVLPSDQSGQATASADYKDAKYIIDGSAVTLKDGFSEVQGLEDTTSKVVTKYFGNEVKTDLNGDGREDVVFILTQTNGGTGTFYYAIAALNTKDGYVGSHGYFIGDRIAPQTTELSQDPAQKDVIVVNYMDRAPSEPLAARPSVGKSAFIKLDTATMKFNDVKQDSQEKTDANEMSLDKKTWTWIKTTYSNDTELAPKAPKAFTITFKKDNTFSATTDCNGMSGSYEVKDNNISFGENMAMTLKFCDDSQEQDFVALLGKMQSYSFTKQGDLIFDLKMDSGSAIFR